MREGTKGKEELEGALSNTKDGEEMARSWGTGAKALPLLTVLPGLAPPAPVVALLSPSLVLFPSGSLAPGLVAS